MINVNGPQKAKSNDRVRFEVPKISNSAKGIGRNVPINIVNIAECNKEIVKDFEVQIPEVILTNEEKTIHIKGNEIISIPDEIKIVLNDIIIKGAVRLPSQENVIEPDVVENLNFVEENECLKNAVEYNGYKRLYFDILNDYQNDSHYIDGGTILLSIPDYSSNTEIKTVKQSYNNSILKKTDSTVCNKKIEYSEYEKHVVGKKVDMLFLNNLAIDLDENIYDVDHEFFFIYSDDTYDIVNKKIISNFDNYNLEITCPNSSKEVKEIYIKVCANY